MSTNKKTVTAYIPIELDDEIWNLQMRPEYVRMTHSQLCKKMIELGLEVMKSEVEKREAAKA